MKRRMGKLSLDWVPVPWECQTIGPGSAGGISLSQAPTVQDSPAAAGPPSTLLRALKMIQCHLEEPHAHAFPSLEISSLLQNESFSYRESISGNHHFVARPPGSKVVYCNAPLLGLATLGQRSWSDSRLLEVVIPGLPLK